MTPPSFGPPPVLEAPRILLRPFALADADAMYAYGSDPEVARHTSWNPHQAVSDSEAVIRSFMARYEAGEPPTWAVVRRDTGEVIGGAGFVYWIPDQRRSEIGYVLRRSMWGEGFMPEAVRALLRFGFGEKEMHRIEAIVKVPNTASARVLEKVGMRLEGVLRGYKWKNGLAHDMRMYAMLAADFKG